MSQEEDRMKMLPVFLGLIIFYGLTGAVSAEIYSWTDAAGVRHFSNHAPPKEAEVVSVIEETPYVEPSAEERLQVQQAERLAEAQQEIAEVEAERIERQRATEREIEAANRKAARAIEEAEERLKAAGEKSDSSKSKSIYSVYFPIRPHFPFHSKERIHAPLRDRPDLHKKSFDGRKGISIRKFNDRGPGHLDLPGRNRVHCSGGFAADEHPGIPLRIR